MFDLRIGQKKHDGPMDPCGQPRDSSSCQKAVNFRPGYEDAKKTRGTMQTKYKPVRSIYDVYTIFQDVPCL